MAGGHSKPRKPTDEEKAFLISTPIRKLMETELKSELAVLDPILVTTQVVAGTNYKVKYHIGDGNYVHAKIFEPLPCYADEQNPQVSSFEANKSEQDEL